ncbi:hypothetical protein DET49_1475 [Salegentibacter sp. 24]|uniref:hypothetical protein n=1 Tax=Salegentibacter sp. 24 TaxID=2183986 RepID=UPI00105E4DC0|nr:hypothetical protein [Salegentibacter sp. 24]TDN78378.1 hypothetical protein DET49_1475 [Salegentibacter sp. 24]
MKTLVIIMILVSLSFTSQAQEITELKETNIGFTPISLAETDHPDEYRYIVNDAYAKEFLMNPIGFVESYFDIDSFIEQVEDKNYHTYLVLFSHEKGYLEADYSKDGELKRTRQSFKDIPLPLAVRNELWKQTEGWTMVKNTYKAIGNGSILDKQIYRIKVVQNDKSKIVKIDPSKIEEERVAGM